MKVVERKWNYGTYLAYEDVEPELLNMKKDDRVLPAPSFYEKNLYYFLIARFEPGENKYYPNGGFEVRGPSMEKRSYELDQVILHPAIIKHKVTLDKMKRKAEKELAKRIKNKDKADKKAAKEASKGGKRGRKPLSDEERLKRELAKKEKSANGTGKRGRPAGTSTKPKIFKVSTGGKRGRRPLDPELKAKREAEKLKKAAISGGKRGRPSTLTPEQREEKYKAKLKGYGKRGRPKTK